MSRDISISAPQAGHSDMAASSGDPQWKHWSNGIPSRDFLPRGDLRRLNAACVRRQDRALASLPRCGTGG